jgi:hypothetical protein
MKLANGTEATSNLFGSHFSKLRDLDHNCVRYLFEVGPVGRFIPPEIVRIVYKILHHEILRLAALRQARQKLLRGTLLRRHAGLLALI